MAEGEARNTVFGQDVSFGAQLRRLREAAGHTPWMSHKKEYLSVINEFLDR